MFFIEEFIDFHIDSALPFQHLCNCCVLICSCLSSRASRASQGQVLDKRMGQGGPRHFWKPVIDPGLLLLKLKEQQTWGHMSP